MGKIEEAIKKINTTIQEKPNDRYRVLVGEHIIDQITTEEAAEKILREDKSLAGAMKAIWMKAAANEWKNEDGKCAVVEGTVVFGWAREYFGIDETAKPQPSAEKTQASVHLSLDDFF